MIAVARITKSVGLKGEVVVSILGEHLERLSDVKRVAVGKTTAETQILTIEAVAIRNGRTVVKFSDVESRNEADALKNLWLFVDDEQSVRPGAGSYFVHDIIGLAVESDDGRVLGTLKDVANLPAGDVWIVETREGDVMIPAVKEFVRNVDLKRGKIVIHVIEGLVK
jgi:16S rRNA processing protein RimM